MFSVHIDVIRLIWETYGGATLFDQFDEEVQNHIQNFFDELVSIIDEAYRLLERKKGSTSPVTPSSSLLLSSTAAVSNTSTMSDSSHNANKHSSSHIPVNCPTRKVTSIQRWRWSLVDKKRITAIIVNFSGVNDRIHANIKLWCLSTSIGVDLHHLRRLEDDENSKKLGFDIDAKLQLVSQASQRPAKSMEIQDRSLQLFMQQSVSIESNFAMFHWDTVPMIVENRYMNLDSNDRMRARIEHLARLLHQEKETLFRILPCKGWVYDSLQANVFFLFAAPQAIGRPFSLLSAMKSAAQKISHER